MIDQCLPKDSWLKKWMECWPVSESPRSYLLFSALSMLGAVLGRRVWFSQDDLKLFPMLNILIIGPSGVGKSTALSKGFSLVWGLPKPEQPQIIMGAASVPKLHEDLEANPHAVLYASELANFFSKQKYMEDLVPYVTELLDYRHAIERRFKNSGLVSVPEPTVTVAGCSTVEWLQEQLPDSATGGGFLPRFLIVAEEHKAQRVPLAGRHLTRQRQFELERTRIETYNRFQSLIENCPHGPVDFRDYSASDKYIEWYINHKPISGHLAPFHARAGEFVLRLSLLVAISCGRRQINSDDLVAGVKLYQYCEGKLQNVVVPMTVQGKLLALVLQAVDGPKTEQEICQAMRNFIPAQETRRFLDSLVISGDLQKQEGKYRRI